MYFDFVAGHVRLESWISPNPNPGINGISLWDLRAPTPLLNFISPKATCMTQVLDSDDDVIPVPDDYTDYKFTSLGYWNRALAEKWMDTDGNYLYLDVFTRDIVGMGSVANKSDPDDQDIDYQIWDWSSDAPSGDLFLLPSTVQCTPVTPAVIKKTQKRFLGIGAKKQHEKCDCCLKGMRNVHNLACGAPPKKPGGPRPPPPSQEDKEKACKIYMPGFAMCAMVMGNACDEGMLHPKTICKQQGACK
jgi:hypothetical protein